MLPSTAQEVMLLHEIAPIDATKIIESPASVPVSRAIVSGLLARRATRAR